MIYTVSHSVEELIQGRKEVNFNQVIFLDSQEGVKMLVCYIASRPRPVANMKHSIAFLHKSRKDEGQLLFRLWGDHNSKIRKAKCGSRHDVSSDQLRFHKKLKGTRKCSHIEK
jgi:hypothetical protein